MSSKKDASEAKDKLTSILLGVNDWIKFSDHKGSLIVGCHGFFLAVFISSFFKIIVKRDFSLQTLLNFEFSCVYFKSYSFDIFVLLYLLFSCLSLFFAFSAIFPRLTKPKEKSKSKKTEERKGANFSKVYFQDIARYYKPSEHREYLGDINITSHSNWNKDFAGQIIINSKIASKKFSKIKWSCVFLYVSSSLWFFLFLIFVLVKK